jgi:hypothetical protein
LSLRKHSKKHERGRRGVKEGQEEQERSSRDKRGCRKRKITYRFEITWESMYRLNPSILEECYSIPFNTEKMQNQFNRRFVKSNGFLKTKFNATSSLFTTPLH